MSGSIIVGTIKARTVRNGDINPATSGKPSMYTKAVIEKVDNTLRKIEARASKSSDIKPMCKTAEEAGAHDGELKKEKYNNFLDESVTRIPPLVSMSESTSSGSSPSPGTHVTRTPHGYSCLAAQREQNESPETKFRINSEIHRVGGQNWGERRRKNAWDRAYRDCAGIPQIQKVNIELSMEFSC